MCLFLLKYLLKVVKICKNMCLKYQIRNYKKSRCKNHLKKKKYCYTYGFLLRCTKIWHFRFSNKKEWRLSLKMLLYWLKLRSTSQDVTGAYLKRAYSAGEKLYFAVNCVSVWPLFKIRAISDSSWKCKWLKNSILWERQVKIMR